MKKRGFLIFVLAGMIAAVFPIAGLRAQTQSINLPGKNPINSIVEPFPFFDPTGFPWDNGIWTDPVFNSPRGFIPVTTVRGIFIPGVLPSSIQRSVLPSNIASSGSDECPCSGGGTPNPPPPTDPPDPISHGPPTPHIPPGGGVVDNPPDCVNIEISVGGAKSDSLADGMLLLFSEVPFSVHGRIITPMR